MIVKKFAYMAILTALAVIIYVAESWVPLPIPIPGVKLGLANTITLFALFYKYPTKQPSPLPVPHGENTPWRSAKTSQASASIADTFTILVARILIGSLLTGRFIAFAYSLTGGVFAFLAMLATKRLVTNKQVWVLGVIGAIFHNIGQLLMATIVTGTPWILTYLPILIISGIITGALTGMIAQLTLLRIMKNKSVDI